MYLTRNTLSASIRAKSVDLLNRHLAAAIDLQAQLKQARWTVRGTGITAICELFDRIAAAFGAYPDQMAERIGVLGGVANGTVQAAADATFLRPYPLHVADGPSHLRAVAEALAAFGGAVREAFDQASSFRDNDAADIFAGVQRGDAGTTRVFGEISFGVDQLLWLVESHFEPVAEPRESIRPALLATDSGSSKVAQRA